ncbi:MAG: lactate dehydrogenase [Methanomicrobiales archaeon]|nr:lactate dehydrogenase [Methanomicrobiales archaeon]
MTSLSITGVGRIGGEVAFLASYLGLVDELVLYDIQSPLLEAQVKDLLHGMIDLEISTDPENIKHTDLCVFTAGMPRNPGIRARADLLHANLTVANQVLPYLKGFDGILVTVVNPVDVLNYYFSNQGSIDSHRCIGFGGQLDSARFALELSARRIEGPRWVLGEHGEHQVPIFSRLYTQVSREERDKILQKLRTASMEVIRGKGGTVYGPTVHLLNLMEAIIDDTQALFPVSCILSGEYGVSGCSLGVPAEVGWGGILSIEEWALDEWEKTQFAEAACFLQGLCGQLYDS